MQEAAYVVGIDLGQSRDPTAVAVVRQFGDPFLGEELYQCGYLERLPLNSPYPAIVTHVSGLLARLPRGTELVIDFTGVGRPVFDMFETAGIDPIGVQITGGTTESGNGRIYSVPKLSLISGVQALLHEERLKIHRDLSEAPALVAELQNFRVDYTAAGHLTFNARSGAHDDMVLALAIATWRAKQAGGPPLLSYYRAQVESAKVVAAALDGPDTDAGTLPWPRMQRQAQEEAKELTQIYLDTLTSVQASAELCSSCGRPLGATRINDGVNRWHPDCRPPRLL